MAKISINHISRAIYESLKDKKDKDLDLAIQNVIEILRNKNLLGKKEEILKKIEEISNKEEGIVKAKIYTRDKLGEQEEKEFEELIKHKYKSKHVDLEKESDPKMLGGVKIQVEDEITDLTLSNKLHQLKNYLITN